MKYRLGLDIGTNSIGWCALKLSESGKPVGILDSGVRILSPNEEAGKDPQSKASLAADRRAARATRRRRDRFIRRRDKLMELLVEIGLMPADPAERRKLEQLDPYWLRAAALNESLTAHELGRVLFHLNQRRGFKSNRLADADDNEKSATRAGIQSLEDALDAAGARTLGEFLAHRNGRDKFGKRLPDGAGFVAPKSVRFRPTSKGAKNLYAFYPVRLMVERELIAIWSFQAPHHPQLTEAVLEKLKWIILEQRPLRKPAVGRCTLRPDEDKTDLGGVLVDNGERIPKAHPLFQRFRILQDVAQLRIVRPGVGERRLKLAERDALAGLLMARSGHTVKFDKLRSAAKLPDDIRFNYELAGRTGLPPDQTAAKLAAGKAFGKQWRSFPRERQIEVVERLLAVEDPSELKNWLAARFEIDQAQIDAISDARLPQGHGRFGRSILADLVNVMETQWKEDREDPETGEVYRRPLEYSEAVEALDLHHSDLKADGRSARLPYYGSVLSRHVIAKPDAPPGSQEAIGRVPNPTVHIGLNQIRKLINTLIDVYGKPAEIAVELARELKLNKKRKDEIQRENRENEKKNLDRRKRLEALKQTHNLDVADTYDARLRLRLFDELPADERVCVFTGAPISMERLFDGSIEIEHVLPHSATLDDSFANKVLCTREINRIKENKSPAEKWSGDELQTIVERAERLFPRKAWRFQPDAMKRFEADGGFLARQLTDTQHMARMTRTYLEHVCDQVWGPPGRLTAMLRARWGLNDLPGDHNYADVSRPKNRKDHRHHAIDAFVVACTDRGLLNRMARASGLAEDMNLDRLFPKGEFPEPFEGHRDALFGSLQQIVVSHKPDHGIPPGAQENAHVTSGQLHEETAYGPADDVIDGKHYNLVARKRVDALNANMIDRVRDAELRSRLKTLATEAERSGQDLTEALRAFGEANGIRRVRVLETRQSTREVLHGNGYRKAYVPGDNQCCDIFELSDGSWSGEGVTVFDANQPGYQPEWRTAFPDARLVMRVHNGDLVEADFGDGQKIYRVVRLEPSAKRIRLVAHLDAGSFQERHKNPADPFRWNFATYKRLKDAKASRVRVDPIGRVFPVSATG